ncbi:hypothetical protein JYB62_01200 [Algoriphagus lutimaris]|uniref:hypothetical protein n=1 Tax=Algoriphagus lutimaris TaxID=613197 RepID=UPI00196B4A7A|nr:hypothetical protein [Algoriphagus lutimaris]MBN3518603.1 hypothetical protein [Algoriphagus lutimaris]
MDYLGDLMLLDYDPEKEKYLLSNDTYNKYLEEGELGEILCHHQFNLEGIDAVDLPFPAASYYPMVVNKKGELVVSKDGNLSDTEDDGIFLYKLKLVKK